MYKLIEKIKSLYPKKTKRRRKGVFWLQKIKKNFSFDNSERSKFKKRKNQLSFNIDSFNKIAFLKKNRKVYYSAALWVLVFTIIFVVFGPYFTVKNVNILKKDNLTNINIAYKAITNIRWKSIFAVK